ncbi:MAG: hypothetical protein QF371_07905, partial [Flavobacteriales bacterium]|nr:hypothetical protein [Flavobacteriales bacterium]
MAGLKNLIGVKAAEKLIFLTILILMLVPIFENPVFMTGDGPAHLYNSHILKELISGNAELYDPYFELNHLPEPNWMGHVLLTVLLFVFEPFTAEKILVGFYVVMFMFGFRYLVAAFKDKNLWTSYFAFA